MRKLRPAEIPRLAPEDVDAAPRHPVVALADDVRSIHNVGSLFRTADAAGLAHLYLTGITGTPDHPRLHKTALGAQDVVPWTHEPDAVRLVGRLREEGYTIAVLEITDTPTRTDALEPGHFPLCLIVGNEVDGVRDELVELADMALEIPQYGTKHSLNVSVAFGIAVFDAVRRLRRTSDPS